MIAMLDCHRSQFYEWLPYNAGHPEQVPAGDDERRVWLARRMGRRIRPLADRYRDLVVRTYGPDRGPKVEYVEAFEVSEYGAPLDAAERVRLFPFLPTTAAGAASFARKEWVDLPEEG